MPVYGPDESEIITDDLVSNKYYEDMTDVELILRFFAYRQKEHHNTNTLSLYFDRYLKYGNTLTPDILNLLKEIFERTTELVFLVFGEPAFHLYRYRSGRWGWLERPTTAIYDPLMYVMDTFIDRSEELIGRSEFIKGNLEDFYQQNNTSFVGRNIKSNHSCPKRHSLF